jgi:hypothetical protein
VFIRVKSVNILEYSVETLWVEYCQQYLYIFVLGDGGDECELVLTLRVSLGQSGEEGVCRLGLTVYVSLCPERGLRPVLNSVNSASYSVFRDGEEVCVE